MRRLTELDGLRGIAALVVVVFHVSLIARPYVDSNNVGDLWWWISDSPLKIATAGTQAVLLFFVLSGLVVALPALRPGFSWKKYYSARLVRLYIPSWAALALASVLIFVVPRHGSAVVSGSWIDTTNARSTPIGTLLADATLMKVGNAADNVLWSLRWEIVFSVLLPLFVVAAILIKRFWIAAIVVCLAITATAQGSHTDPRMYLPIFFIGTLMALHLDEIREWSARRGTAFWATTLVASLACMIASQTLHSIAPSTTIAGHILWALVGLGSAGIILCAIGSTGVRDALNMRAPRFLGKISFSLYLVHVPILATLGYALGDAQWWVVGIVGVPVSIAFAVVFHRFIEVPSHRLAHAIGSRVTRNSRVTESAVVPAIPLEEVPAAVELVSPGALQYSASR
jgi:peptidoglycan/LPS O-acetylase OafA/YrhL